MTERRSKVYYLIHYYYLIHHGIFFANKYGIEYEQGGPLPRMSHEAMGYIP